MAAAPAAGAPAEVLDVAAQRRLQELVKKATDHRQFSLDPGLLRDVKGMCRVADANVCTAYAGICEALKADHAQRRLLAVELADVLFQRSKVFRGLLAPGMTAFLEQSVGFKRENPLPGPADRAVVLRERALEVLEGWNEKFGALYHQVALAMNYLKNTLKYRFPEVHSRSAAERAREQQAANEAYARIQRDQTATLDDITSILRQLEEALALAEAPAAEAAAAAAEEAEMGWEDAARPGSLGDDAAAHDGGGSDGEDAGGLAAYAAGEDAPGPAAAAGDQQADAAADTTSVDAPAAEVDLAVAESLVDLGRLLAGHALPTLRRWLDVLVKADAGAVGSAERAERDALLRTALERRTAVQEALAGLGAARVRLPSLGAAMAAAEAARTPAGAEAAAAGRAAAATPPPRPDDMSPEERAAVLESARRHAALQDPAAPKSAWTLDGRFEGREVATDTSPAKIMLRGAAAAAAGSARPEAAGDASERSAGQAKRTSRGSAAVSDDVKRKLLSSAPVVPAGGHLSYWDSASATTARMEVQNHWGPVDHDQQVDLRQLEQMAVNHVAQYYTPAAAGGSQDGGTPAAKPDPRPASPLQAAGADDSPQPKKKAPGVTRIGAPAPRLSALTRSIAQPASAADAASAQEAAAAAPAASSIGRGPQLAPSEQPSAADKLAALVASADAARPASPAGLAHAHRAGAPPAAVKPTVAAQSGAGSTRGDKAYNAAVLAGAQTDEAIARNIADSEAQAARAAGNRKRKSKESMAARLSKRLAKAETRPAGQGPKHSLPGKGFVFIR